MTKRTTKRLRVAGLILFFFISLCAVGILHIVPFREIVKLKQGYVSVTVTNKTAQYTITPQKPARWSSFHEFDTLTRTALLFHEDNRFYHHCGINFHQIQNALIENWFEGQPLRGASTLTQQLAKNIFLSPDRTVVRKIKEACIAIQMERKLTKEEIIEIYLNVVNFGNGQYGLPQAAHYYFHKPHNQLNIKETIYLMGLLPNPDLYANGFHQKALTKRDSSNIDHQLKRMHRKRLLDSLTYHRASLDTLKFPE